MQSPAPLVSVVILTYNSADYVTACLSSLKSSLYRPVEIIVADNASRDDSATMAQRAAEGLSLPARVTRLVDNRGCAGGNNAGWRESAGSIVIFLNPDTEVTEDFIGQLVAPIIEEDSIGITGAKIYYPGTRVLQHAGAVIHSNAMTNHFGAGEEDTGQHNAVRDVDYVTGAGFAIRRDVLEKLGGFDEDFFPAYFEEVDLCTRVRKAGFRVVYVPTAILYHHESVSLVANSPGFRRLYQRMRIRYCIKNFSLRHWVRRFAPAEIRWMLREPAARGQRLEQIRAYAENIAWLIRRKFKHRSR